MHGVAVFLILAFAQAQAGPYAGALDRLLKSWPLGRGAHSAGTGSSLELECIRDAGNPRLVGLEQTVFVEAPFERFARVLDDMEHYIDLSPGFKEIRVVKRSAASIETFWEKRVPVFFLPNIRYSMSYEVRRLKNAVAYRYRLGQSEQLRSADGLMVIEKARGVGQRAGGVYFKRYDFIDAAAGVYATAPASQIWSGTVEDIFLSDAGLKLKAEHPDWDNARVVERAKDLLQAYPMDELLAGCRASF